MNKIESLSDLFQMVGCDVQYYDLGRCIRKITPQQAIQFDRQQQGYPFPYHQNAWLACLLTPQNTAKKDIEEQGVIWFIKLPIDEAGCLNLGTRDHFIKSIVDKILHKGEEAGLSEALEDNPYAFQPDQERMASLHAILSKSLKRSTSHFFEECVEYLKTELPDTQEKWQQIGLQGIAELATRADEAEYQAIIETALSKAENPIVTALCHALEHQVLPEKLQTSVITQLTKEADPIMQASYLRALSRSDLDNALLLPLFSLLGNVTECSDDDIQRIAVLVAKCPHWLEQNPQLLRIIMEKLAHRNDDYIAFKRITSELSQHPETKTHLWTLLRSNHISAGLAQAVSKLFKNSDQTVH